MSIAVEMEQGGASDRAFSAFGITGSETGEGVLGVLVWGEREGDLDELETHIASQGSEV